MTQMTIENVWHGGGFVRCRCGAHDVVVTDTDSIGLAPAVRITECRACGHKERISAGRVEVLR